MADFDKKAKEQKKKEERDRLAKEAKEKEKKDKAAARAEEQKKKSEEGAKKAGKDVKVPTGIAAILAAEKEAEEALAAKISKKAEEDLAARDTRAAANGAGDEQLFGKKMSKEERKAAAAAKRAEKAASKGSSGSLQALGDEASEEAGEDSEAGMSKSASSGSLNGTGNGGGATGSGGKVTALGRVNREKSEIEAELQAARETAARCRSKLGAYRGALEASHFTLPNPGGGAPLLEDAACTLVRGRCYGLIGRNGKGKSTMLRAFAARRVGDVPGS